MAPLNVIPETVLYVDPPDWVIDNDEPVPLEPEVPEVPAAPDDPLEPVAPDEPLVPDDPFPPDAPDKFTSQDEYVPLPVVLTTIILKTPVDGTYEFTVPVI